MTDNPFFNKAAEEASKALFQLVWSLLKGWGKKQLDERNVKKALSQYTENFFARNGQIKVLGMSQPVPLSEIYTSVNILPVSYLVKDQPIEKLESEFRRTRNFYEPHARKDAIEMANKTSKLSLLGPPGSGKSTFLKKIGMEALVKSPDQNGTSAYQHNCLPVLVELRRFRQGPVDLKAAIQKEFEIVGFPESEFFIEKILHEGRLLILLDGLDEVPSATLQATIEHISDFTDQYKANRFIISCRTAFYKTFFKAFTDVEIANFNDAQVKKFIKNWFHAKTDLESEIADRLITLLFTKSNASALELSRTPLLLTFLCITFDESQRFPPNRSSLYKRALYILLEKWAAEKRIHNEDIYQDFPSDLEVEMLAEMAAHYFRLNRIFFFGNELKAEIETFFQNSFNAKPIRITKVIEAIEVQQGLLVQRAPDIYSFSHLTIQEYLTALYYHAPNRTKELVCKYFINEPRWREVFLLQAGIATADGLLAMMMEALQGFVMEHNLLKEAFHWVNEILPHTENVELDACKRLWLVSLLLRFKRYDPSISVTVRLEESASKLIRMLDPSFAQTFELTQTLNKKQTITILRHLTKWQDYRYNYTPFKEKLDALHPDRPVSKMIYGSRHAYRKQISDILYEAIRVPSGLGDLNRTRYNPLVSYIEAYTLLIECHYAALRSSNEMHRQIMEQLVRVVATPGATKSLKG